ncbi:histidine phosphatase family protein [Nocardia flavorosea]|uniref:histidine phosphatase family protein n=1 Tax=Nocardia flavorosea TaxID=53429 RepID=UPI00245871F0|nr:histidine phosphatase family protein [Nocardia flavorosea]
MTRLLLIRHGAAANRGLIASTRTCRGLSPLGHNQARALAQRVATEQRNLRATIVYTTTVPRARQTGEHLARALGVPLRAELPGPNYGTAEGRYLAEVLARREVSPALEPDTPLAEGAEPWTVLSSRVSHELAIITDRHPDETVAVVCHRQNIVAATQSLLGAPPTVEHASIELGPTSITDWQQRPVRGARTSSTSRYRWVLLRCNDLNHLNDVDRVRAG